MSNLGKYQVVTTLMKKMGGPDKAIAKAVAGVAVITIAGWEAGKWGVGKIREKFTKDPEEWKKYSISKSGVYKELSVKPGDVITVMEQDGEAVLIAVDGRKDNPFMVSAEWLKDVSEFE